ncbi:hypothetical protein [Nonomuraea salmonea]|uniref:hypothetical protein n=1 Tax=Nonomuraea salmonea TaxID=46181 RepID=UPI0031EFD273
MATIHHLKPKPIRHHRYQPPAEEPADPPTPPPTRTRRRFWWSGAPRCRRSCSPCAAPISTTQRDRLVR